MSTSLEKQLIEAVSSVLVLMINARTKFSSMFGPCSPQCSDHVLLNVRTKEPYGRGVTFDASLVVVDLAYSRV